MGCDGLTALLTAAAKQQFVQPRHWKIDPESRHMVIPSEFYLVPESCLRGVSPEVTGCISRQLRFESGPENRRPDSGTFTEYCKR